MKKIRKSKKKLNSEYFDIFSLSFKKKNQNLTVIFD